jgi:hypothetical protein
VVITKGDGESDEGAGNLTPQERGDRKFKRVTEELEQGGSASRRRGKSSLPRVYADFKTTPFRLSLPASEDVRLDLKPDAGQ